MEVKPDKPGIWTRIKLYAERKEREAWMEKRHCAQHCYHCRTWQGNCGGWRAIEPDPLAVMHDRCACNRRRQKTTFFDVGMGFRV